MKMELKVRRMLTMIMQKVAAHEWRDETICSIPPETGP